MEDVIRKVEDEGFLRKMKTDEELYEINRVTKAFVNADVVKDSLEKLKMYSQQTFIIQSIELLESNYRLMYIPNTSRRIKQSYNRFWNF